MARVRELDSGHRPVLCHRRLWPPDWRHRSLVRLGCRASCRTFESRVSADEADLGGHERRPMSTERSRPYDSQATTTCGSGTTVPSFRVYLVKVSSVKMIAALPSSGLIATSNRSSKFLGPLAQPVPFVQITPTWFGWAETAACGNWEPSPLVGARNVCKTPDGWGLTDQA